MSVFYLGYRGLEIVPESEDARIGIWYHVDMERKPELLNFIKARN